MAQTENKPVMYSALEVAKLCGVVNQTAINWIKNNHLKAFNTPGGQFRVYPEDLVEFMKSRNIQIPSELRAVLPGGIGVSRSLLIVDDDRGLNSVVAKFMQKKIENLEVFQAFDGFDLCRRINESDRFGKPEIIIVTALENEDAEKQVREFGVRSYIRKPLDLLKLVSLVGEILS